MEKVDQLTLTPSLALPRRASVVMTLKPFDSSDEFLAWCLERLTEEGSLTPAESDICELLMLGRAHAEIALVRGTTVGTVQGQVQLIRRKLGITSPREMLWLIASRLDK